MPQYHTTSDPIYEYKQSAPSTYQENYSIMYPHSNFQHYRSSVPLSSGYDFTYDYNQQYYPCGE